MKVYTKTGDKGTTSLVGGERVAKNHPRLEAYGSIDELMAFTAYLRDTLPEAVRFSPYREDLLVVLDHLMRASSHLATEGEAPKYLPTFGSEHVAFLEQRIDTMQATLPSIMKFTLPGGHAVVSLSHICRTVCRRSERVILTLSDQCIINEYIMQYVNRLSDYFYVLGRKLTEELHIKEILWEYKE